VLFTTAGEGTGERRHDLLFEAAASIVESARSIGQRRARIVRADGLGQIRRLVNQRPQPCAAGCAKDTGLVGHQRDARHRRAPQPRSIATSTDRRPGMVFMAAPLRRVSQ
jgi:hypothetical protein